MFLYYFTVNVTALPTFSLVSWQFRNGKSM